MSTLKRMLLSPRLSIALFLSVQCFFLSLYAGKRVSNKTLEPFSHTICKFFSEQDITSPEVIWEKKETQPFSELIVSWNGHRPPVGSMTVYVSVYHRKKWTPWHRLALWKPNYQRTFVNKLSPYVHTKHCRVEMQQGFLARGFRVKTVFSNGAQPTALKALFGCISRPNHLKVIQPDAALPSTVIRGVPRQSQLLLDHYRFRDLCSPTSMSMAVAYYYQKLYGRIPKSSMHDFAIDFAEKSHDQHINIYGNWILNVAHAFDACNGDVFFRVERLNSFYHLHAHLVNQVPVVVSVRRLLGGATPYSNGHLMVVVGWNAQKRHVLCLDPAFGKGKPVMRAYRINDFLSAWSRSSNLAYVPMPKAALS